jgi:hypothetical protein
MMVLRLPTAIVKKELTIQNGLLNRVIDKHSSDCRNNVHC